MPRLHLVELEDLPWLPAPVRDAATGYLQLMIHQSDAFAPAVPLLADAVSRSGAVRIVDLCSGGGGPWRRMSAALRDAGVSRPLLLTDRYPNPGAVHAVTGGSASLSVAMHPASVDATQVPASLEGFRTMFSAFHHFRPHDARAVLADAVADGTSIAIFERTKRNLTCFLLMMVTPLFVLLGMPAVRPFRLTNLLFTYLLPLVPLVVLWDGIVSTLRTYDVEELRALVATVPGQERFDWSIGEAAGRGPLPMLYLVGLPRAMQTPAS
jgi:hypothetical protein